MREQQLNGYFYDRTEMHYVVDEYNSVIDALI